MARIHEHDRFEIGDDSSGLARLLVCVDDTDDETKSTSTGKVAELIARAALARGGKVRLGITRHQLLLREDIPYTSHNSSMTFEVLMPPDIIDALRHEAIGIVQAESVASADPGLAFARLPFRSDDADAHDDEDKLIEFGLRATTEFCSKQSAFALAAQIPWVNLSEHGGTGQGVVGALAGIGLRLSGSNGRFRGKLDLSGFSTDKTVSPRPTSWQLAFPKRGTDRSW